MGSQITGEASNIQSGRQNDRQPVGDSYGDVLLHCPVRIAHPHVTPESKTCDNHCNGIRRVKEHVKLRHRCNCPGQPEPCGNPMHLGPTALKQLEAIRHLTGETPGEQWGRIFNMLFPDRTEIPAPYVPSAGDLKAIARAPPPGFAEQLANSFQNVRHGKIEGAHLLLTNLPHFIDLVCRTGFHPDSRATALNGTTVFMVSTLNQGSNVAMHQDSMNDDSEMNALFDFDDAGC